MYNRYYLFICRKSLFRIIIYGKRRLRLLIQDLTNEAEDTVFSAGKRDQRKAKAHWLTNSVSYVLEIEEKFFSFLKDFSSDTPQSIKVRNGPKQLNEAGSIPGCGSKCANQKVKTNWHCFFRHQTDCAIPREDQKDQFIEES